MRVCLYYGIGYESFQQVNLGAGTDTPYLVFPAVGSSSFRSFGTHLFSSPSMVSSADHSWCRLLIFISSTKTEIASEASSGPNEVLLRVDGELCMCHRMGNESRVG